MKVLVVSGFLGAGKTTFIQELARRTGRDFVVYENEYGQADIDAARLAAGSDEGLSVWESTENCICCTGKQDFASSVLTIANSLDPEYLVVEPTGVARLSAVLENVNMVSYGRIEVLPPATVVDAGAWARQRKLSTSIFDDQVRAAGTVVVSKVGACLPEELEELCAWLREQNPAATVVSVPYAQLDRSWFEGLLADGEAGVSAQGQPTAGGGIRRLGLQNEGLESISLAHAELPSEGHLLWFLDALVSGLFGRVARAKGFVSCGDALLRFDVVDRAWCVTGADAGGADAEGADAQLAAVFIGKDLKRGWLREVLLPAVGAAAQARAGEQAARQRYRVDARHFGVRHQNDASSG